MSLRGSRRVLLGQAALPPPTLDLNYLSTMALSPLETFSRASIAYSFNSSGTLVAAPQNLILQSQTFDNASWTKTGTTITANAVAAPDGTTTADKLVEDTGNTTHVTQQAVTVVSGTTYSLSCYFKAAERSLAGLVFGSGFGVVQRVRFDLSAATSTLVSGTATSTITAMGGGWYRCTVTATASASGSTNFVFELISPPSTLTYTGTGTSGIYLWGAQLEVGSTATSYIPTTTAAAYGPRFDYDPSTLLPLGLLLEETRTNSLRNSTMVGAAAGSPGTAPTNWAWPVSGSGITVSIAGTGTTNGIPWIDLTFAGTASPAVSMQPTFEGTGQVSGTVGQTWTNSFFLALVAGTATGITVSPRIREGDAAAAFLTDQIGSTIVPTATLTRYSQTVTLPSATAGKLTSGIKFAIANGAVVNATYRIGLPQLELGSFATSPILTTTVAVTRATDICSITTLGSWFNAAAGTILLDHSLQSRKTTGVQVGVMVDDNTINNRIGIFATDGIGMHAQVITTAGVGQFTGNIGTPVANTRYVVALAYATNDAASYKSPGGQSAADTSVTLPVVTQMRIGHRGSDFLCGWVRRIAYFDRRLPDAKLPRLTT